MEVNEPSHVNIRVGVVLLNYKNYEDTIACARSVLEADYDDKILYIVDNNSGNESSEVIRKFVEEVDSAHRKIVFIESSINGGFASGNNMGIRKALQDGCAYIWILNNDTLVNRGAIRSYIRRYNAGGTQGGRIGIIGAKIKYYSSPDIIQGIGGRYVAWLGKIRHVGEGERDIGQYDGNEFSIRANYPLGVSMFVHKSYIEDVGLLNEDYFLYFEELDWTIRGKRRGWAMDYCSEVVVLHKEGASIGSSTDGQKKSLLSDVEGMRSKFLFTRTFYPYYFPTLMLSLIIVVANRLRRGQFDRVRPILEAAWQGAVGGRKSYEK